VNVEPDGFIFYAIYVDDLLYILNTIDGSREQFLKILDGIDLDIFTGYSNYARVFNSRNGLPEYKTLWR
jgi:hypothetical protein